MTGPGTVEVDLNHVCRAGRGCRERWRTEQGVWVGRLTDRPNTLCGACRWALRTSTTRLWHDHRALTGVIGERGPGAAVKVDSTPVSAAPINLQADALRTEIVEVALHCAELITDRVDCPDVPTRGPEPDRLAAYTAVIEAHLDVLLEVPNHPIRNWADNGWYEGPDETDGPALAIRLIRLHQRVDAHLGLNERRWKLDAPCPRCERTELERSDQAAGGTQVSCTHCGHRMTEDAYRQATLITVERPGPAPLPARPRRIPTVATERFHPQFGVGR